MCLKLEMQGMLLISGPFVVTSYLVPRGMKEVLIMGQFRKVCNKTDSRTKETNQSLEFFLNSADIL